MKENIRKFSDATLWNEENEDGTDTICKLNDGFIVKFWLEGLTDKEYYRRTKEIQRLENSNNQEA